MVIHVTMISFQDARIFVLGLYKVEFFKYLILSYTICLKLYCVDFVEEQIKMASAALAKVAYVLCNNHIEIIYHFIQVKGKQLTIIKQERKIIQKVHNFVILL